jgi:hypothetical protein
MDLRPDNLIRRPFTRAYSSAWLERFPDKEEVDGSSPSRPTQQKGGKNMKKLLSLALLALTGYVVYQQIEASKAEQELWTQATSQ